MLRRVIDRCPSVVTFEPPRANERIRIAWRRARGARQIGSHTSVTVIPPQLSVGLWCCYCGRHTPPTDHALVSLNRSTAVACQRSALDLAVSRQVLEFAAIRRCRIRRTPVGWRRHYAAAVMCRRLATLQSRKLLDGRRTPHICTKARQSMPACVTSALICADNSGRLFAWIMRVSTSVPSVQNWPSALMVEGANWTR